MDQDTKKRRKILKGLKKAAVDVLRDIAIRVGIFTKDLNPAKEENHQAACVTKRYKAPANLTLTQEEINNYVALCDDDPVEHPHNREGHQMRVMYMLICDGCGHQASIDCSHDSPSNEYGFCRGCSECPICEGELSAANSCPCYRLQGDNKE